MKLKIYSVSDEYVKYLRQFDDKVYDNKEDKRIHTRKYVGIVLTINNINYYVPMSSPKESDYFDKERKKIRPSVNTIIRMVAKNKNQEPELRGTLRISNMIPVPIEEIIPYNINNESDEKYKDIIKDEIAFIREPANENKIMAKAQLVYNQKSKQLDIKYLKNCVNYQLLEEKCKDYIIQKHIQNDEVEAENNRIQEILPQLKYIKDIDDLYYIYDNLNNQDDFEEVAQLLDTPIRSSTIQTMSKDDINNIISRQIDNKLHNYNNEIAIESLTEGNETPDI